MKNVFIIAAIACSILFSFRAVMADEIVKARCTADFYTQEKFHKYITNWFVDHHDYILISGGNAWRPEETSPGSTLNYFVQTKKTSGESIDDVKKRISIVVRWVIGMPPVENEYRWWIDEEDVSYLLMSM